MLRKALAFSAILVSGLCGATVASAGFLAEAPPAIPGAPYSAVAVTQSTTTFTDGNRITRTNTIRYFRDGQGRTRVERGTSGDSPSITITDPVAGQVIFIHPQTKTAEAIKVPAKMIASEAGSRSPTDGQVPFALLGMGMAIGASLSTEATTSETSLGQKTINGIATAGTRVVRTFPAGVLSNEKPIVSTVEEWDSVDLSVPVQVTQKSSIGGDISLNLTQVVRGEPDAALFAAPAGYAVRVVPSGAGAVSVIATGPTRR